MSPILITFAIFLGIFTQSLSGFGLGLVSMALLAEPLGVQTATPLIALVAITCEVVMLFRYRSAFNLEAVRRLVLASVVGVPLGVILLRQVSPATALTVLGIFLIGYALYALVTPRLPEIKNPRWAYGFGFVAGLLSGAYNTGGPPYVVYGTCSRWQPTEFKSNLQGIFIVNSILVIGSHALSHNFTAPVWQDFLIALPAMALGMWLGFRLDRYVDPAVFRKLVLLLLLLLGASMIF
jgi:uncharacterized membrane protein YfcA